MHGTPKPQPTQPYWTISITPPPTPALRGLQWLYTNYCRLMWETVDQSINQSIRTLPNDLQRCLHNTLTYEERRALRSDVLWLLIEQTRVPIDLELQSTDDLERLTLTQALMELQAIRKALKEWS